MSVFSVNFGQVPIDFDQDLFVQIDSEKVDQIRAIVDENRIDRVRLHVINVNPRIFQKVLIRDVGGLVDGKRRESSLSSSIAKLLKKLIATKTNKRKSQFIIC